MVKNSPATQEIQVQSLGWEDPLEKEMATHPSMLAGKSHGQRSLVGYSPWGHRSWALATKPPPPEQYVPLGKNQITSSQET